MIPGFFRCRPHSLRLREGCGYFYFVEKLKEYELPENTAAEAVTWLTDHVLIAKYLCYPDAMTEEEIDAGIRSAAETRDYTYLVLLLYQKIIQEQNSEEKKPENK